MTCSDGGVGGFDDESPWVWTEGLYRQGTRRVVFEHWGGGIEQAEAEAGTHVDIYQRIERYEYLLYVGVSLIAIGAAVVTRAHGL